MGVGMAIGNCRMIELPKIIDDRGNLSFIEGTVHVPFEIKRTYFLYDVPEKSERGSHAHKNLHQFIVAISGSFDVTLDDGFEKKKFHLNTASAGLYLCPMIWRLLDNFSSGSVCLVLASDFYSEEDYIRSYSDYIIECNDQDKS